MFQLNQIITSTQLIKHFSKVSRYLQANPDPVLITQKGGLHLVVMNAEAFEDLAFKYLHQSGIEPPLAYLRNNLIAGNL